MLSEAHRQGTAPVKDIPPRLSPEPAFPLQGVQLGHPSEALT